MIENYQEIKDYLTVVFRDHIQVFIIAPFCNTTGNDSIFADGRVTPQ